MCVSAAAGKRLKLFSVWMCIIKAIFHLFKRQPSEADQLIQPSDEKPIGYKKIKWKSN